MSLQGKTALITGGAKGIGRCTALYLVREGMNVVIADLDEEAGGECVEEYGGIGPVEFVPTDVSREADVENCVRRAVERFGGLYAVVNNAGIGYNCKIEQLSLADWHRVLDTNLTSCFLTARYAIPHLRKSKGTIVNVASIKGFLAIESEADGEAYSASKGGIIAFTHALAVSQGPDIRVNCVSPGWVICSEWQQKRLAYKRKLTPQNHSQHPVGRVGWPEDIAAMIRYLISDEAGFISGQNFIVDGGMSKKLVYPA